MTYQTVVTDLSDVKRIHQQMDLYLKPIAKVYITVSLPKLKIAGQTISNWELQKKLKELCAPLILKTFTVSKSTMEYIRFESEVSNRASVKSYVAALDYKSIKLAGFPEILKVNCSEAKSSFPTRQDWDEYFGDSNLFDETQPGERPDTIYLSGVPCQFFSDSKTGIVSTDKVDKLFSVYGKVRNIDIPMLDPYRSDVKSSSTKNFKPFSYVNDAQLSFAMYVQFQNYPSFEECMSSFRNMKLLLLENSDKAVAVSIKVDFDRSKHLSDQSIRHRLMEKEKIEKLQRQREEEKRKEKEKAEEKVRRKEEEARREQEVRRQRREERRKRKKQEKDMQIAAAKAAYRIAMEERKLKFASRRLEAIRLVTYLCQRVQRDIEEEETERKRRNARELRVVEERKRKEVEEKKQQRFYKEHELKSRILKRKLEEEYKYGRRSNNTANQQQQKQQRSSTSSSNRR